MPLFRRSAITNRVASNCLQSILPLTPHFQKQAFFNRFSYYIFFTLSASVFTIYHKHHINRMTGNFFTPLFFMGGTNQISSLQSEYLASLFKKMTNTFQCLLNQKNGEDPYTTFPRLSSGPYENRERQENAAEWFLTLLPSSMTMPSLFSLEEIITWGIPKKAAHSNEQVNEPLKCCITVDCNSLDSAIMPCMNDAIRQTASQPDLGETRYYYETHPKDFRNDPTQGPSEQRTAYVAALARWIHRKECDSLAELKKYSEFDECFDYRFGRLTPKLNLEQKALNFLKQHINEIKLNVQRVELDGSNNCAIQVLNFALALGPFDNHAEERSETAKEYIREMCDILLIQEYKAVASVAIREAYKHPEKEIPLSLTLVGGNMFGNSSESIKKGIEAACDTIRHSGVRNIIPVLSAFFSENVELYRTGSFSDAPVLSEEDLAGLSRISDAFSPKLSIKSRVA